MVVGKKEEMVPFVVMVVMEGCTIGLTILAKTAFTARMSPFVFAVYTNALGSLLLFLFSFFFDSGQHRCGHSIFTPALLLRIFFLGFTGVFTFQNLAFVGLSYSSPIVVCAMGLLTPSFSFILSLLLSRTNLDWGSSSTKARVLGSLISFSGAVVEEVYQGPYIRLSSSSSTGQLKSIPQLFVYYKIPDNWVVGGLLLAASALSFSVWNVIQLGTVKRYPQVMRVVFLYSLVGTIQCTVFSLFMERDLSSWRLKPDMNLLLIIVTGIFGSVVRTSFHVKFTKMKGPFYVPLFKPFGIFWATLFGTSFFVNSLHYGSVLGAAIAGMGYYTVMWGQIKEDEDKRKEKMMTLPIEPCPDEHKVPLLKEEDGQV